MTSTHWLIPLNYHPGALTGKYTPENPPTGPRGRIYTPEYLRKASTCVVRFVQLLRSTVNILFAFGCSCNLSSQELRRLDKIMEKLQHRSLRASLMAVPEVIIHFPF